MDKCCIKFVVGKTCEIPRKIYPDPVSSTTNPHAVTSGSVQLTFFATRPLRNNYTVDDKAIHITGHEGPRRTWMQRSTYTQPRHQEEIWVASPTLGRLYPKESPRYSFYRRLSEPNDQSGHEGVKKNLHTSDTRDQTRAVQPVAKRLATCATWPKILQ